MTVLEVHRMDISAPTAAYITQKTAKFCDEAFFAACDEVGALTKRVQNVVGELIKSCEKHEKIESARRSKEALDAGFERQAELDRGWLKANPSSSSKWPQFLKDLAGRVAPSIYPQFVKKDAPVMTGRQNVEALQRGLGVDFGPEEGGDRPD